MGNRTAWFFLAILATAAADARQASAPANRYQPRTFTIREAFGVDHPDQIITFDLDFPVEAATAVLSDQDGKPVPCQVLEGGKKLAVRTDLPAGAARSWRLGKGRPTAPTDGLRVEENTKEGWNEVTSGLLGIRVPLPGLRTDGAPVLAVRTRSGAWLGAGEFQAPKVKSREVKFLEKGPLVVRIEASYLFEPAKDSPAESFYRCTMEVQAGQPSILFEEESNVAVSWSIRLDSLKPDQARYRGHHSSSKELGYEADGRQYRHSHERAPLDAFVDLKYDRPRRYRSVPIWDPWVYDSGWYWQIYGKDAPPAADLVGLYAGRASRAVVPSASGVHLSTRPMGEVALTAVCAPSKGQARARYQWGLFLGTKADLAPPDRVQPIARQMNLRAGFNLDKVHRLVLDFPDPPQGYGSPFMPKKAVEAMVSRLRKDKEGVHGKGYHGLMARADPAARELLAAWADPSGAPIRAVAKAIEEAGKEFLGRLVWGDGIYSPPVHYWHGGLEASRRLVWIDQALGSSVLNPAERARIKAVAVLYGAVLWDNDFVPMDNHVGINLGTPNMPVQQSGYRDQYAIFLSTHPMMKERLAGVVDRTARILTHDINEHGAHIGSVHYVGAGMGPMVSLMQQLQATGVQDFFRDEPRVAKFAEAYLQWATPPEVRFGRYRRMVAVGDGSTASSELFGMMGTGFAASNPALSRKLMGMWRAQGKKHSSFHGTTLLKINDDLPGDPPVLGSANFPGWFTVLRSGGGTPRETAVWFVNGNHYWDHSHSDQGSVVIYALGAPVSVDWGSMYQPRTDGAFFHSLALPESDIGHPWDKDSPPLEAGGAWGTFAGTKTVQDEFRAENGGGWVRATMKAPGGKYSWTRAVSLAMLREDLPVIAIQDSWSGEAAAAPKVFTLNLMAEGDVETPGGKVSPPPRIWGYESRQGGKKELPSAGAVFDLPAGTSRLGFQGQAWKAHPSGGVDWDVYVVSPVPLKAHVGNWANAWSPEAGAFQETNGRPYEERQHILRLRGSAGFRVLVVPWLKGARPADLAVRADGGDVMVSSGGKTVRIGPDGGRRP